jgi:hypothetical protein
MDKINRVYFQKWLLDSLSKKSFRHLFFDLKDRFINNLLNCYNEDGSVNFLPSNYFLWVFYPSKSDVGYHFKDKVSRICDSDLIEIRNSSEENAFVVFISDLSPIIIPSDNITSVSEKYYDSHSSYIDYMCNHIFLREFNFDRKILSELKLFIIEECSENLDYCFYKEIHKADVLEFFGVIGNEVHLNAKSFKLSTYIKDFIKRIQFILDRDSYVGLAKILQEHDVRNYTKAIEEFKREGFNSAKDFSRNINNVFLKNTKLYKSLIDVDEWIEALKDEKEDYSILFEDKDNTDLFSLIRVDKVANDKGNKFILRRENLQTYLDLTKEVSSLWTVNSVEIGEFVHLDVTERNNILKINSYLNTSKKTIKLINYESSLNQNNMLDFGVKIKERYLDGNFLKIKLKKGEKIIEETINKLNAWLSDLEYSKSIGLNKEYEFEKGFFDLNRRNTNIFEIKDDSLCENSDLEFSFRLVSKETEVDLVILEDEGGEYKINFRNRNDIEFKTKITEYDFKDVELFLQNISFNKLYLKISNNGFSEWLIFLFVPESTKTPLIVKNYFQKYQALNDSSLANRVVSIESKIQNDIHSYYFEDKFKFKSTFLPTIFNFEGDYLFNNSTDSNPYFLDTKKYKLETDFRASRANMEHLINSEEFKLYENYRNKLIDWYKSKFLSFDIKSIDDIDFSSDEIFNISEEYLKSYNAMLELNENARWLDTFYICEINYGFSRLENMPLAIFYSPYNPILIFQLSSRMRLMRNTLENKKKPNSISSLLKVNVLDSWVIKDPTLQYCYFSINTDSILFTGFVSKDHLYKNSLEPTLKKFNVSYSQGVGHLSYSQIKSALNKSYSYLSNKSTFNIRLEGNLIDDSTNDSILDWIENKSIELTELYNNFSLQVNIFDNREDICYPNDNLLSYYKVEKSLNFNWYKGNSSITEFDLTLITSFIPDVSIYNQSDIQLLSLGFSYKNMINTDIIQYSNNALYKDIFVINSKNQNAFDVFISLIRNQFKRDLPYNQTKTLINNSSFRGSEVVAISSDISNAFILEEVVGKSLWEFSIADYSYKDSGKGDYFLLANEQEVYTSNFRKFLGEIDQNSGSVFDEFLTYSKKTGLFELKHLISNQNFIKGFIASVAARKILDNVTENSSDSFIIPYDVFKNRLHKIKMEIDPKYKDTGTQYPDFIFVQISKGDKSWIIDLRLIEVKYRSEIISETKISKILFDQTNRIKKILCQLNLWRLEDVNQFGLWVHTLSMILTEMSQFYFNNSLNISSVLKRNFAEAINDNYLCRINDSMLIAVDSSIDISDGTTSSGYYFKFPQSKISQIFANNDDVKKRFLDFFHSMEKSDTCNSALSIEDNINIDESVFNQNDVEADFSENFNIENSNKETPVKKDTEKIISVESKPSSFPTENNFRVVFGKDYSNREVIYYPKGKGSSPLPNYNIMVTGSSGKGKTQFIKSFIYQQGRKDTSFTIIDFKNDYSENEFCELCNLKKISVKLNGIPYNPLIPRVVIDEDSGEKYYDVSEHINGICSVLGSTFGLGDQQEAQLKKSIREVFKLSGLETKGTLSYQDNMSFPTFNEVGNYLVSNKDLEKLYNRLDPLFDLDLFPDRFKKVGFENVIKESYIIKVSDIQNDKIKNAIAKLIVVSAHGYYLGSNHRSNVYKYFVFDEAHRILDSSFVEKFIRECRAFGVGVLLSSQQPDDFPDDVLGQLATKVIHGNEGVAKMTKKIRDLISFNQEDKYISNLQTFEAIVNNQDYNNWIIKTLSWPHIMTLEAIKEFPMGISKDDLVSHLLKRGVKGSELIILLNTLVTKNYIDKNDDVYTII